ncbi:ABC transporter permease [Natronospirillum operosum]|uniref:ABC transporter permease n=1 Tax=Natronospirillum operosum TaxID=2759953 RepID=A0A4Z0W973_9GAMM|nr:ABC transporter permease [Natronospirillum operosum]
MWYRYWLHHINADRVAQVLSIPLFLLLWQWVSASGVVSSRLFPPPTEVISAFGRWYDSGQFWGDVQVSLTRVGIGFFFGSVIGILVGILTGRVRLAANLLSPIFGLLRPIPPIAFVPLVILWFGLSETGKYFLVFWGVFFVVWMSAHHGVRKVDPLYIRVAQCLGTPRSKMLTNILLPGAIPYIIVGLRTAVSISFYTLVAAEIAGTFSGIFYRIDVSQQNMQIGQAMAGLLVLGVISLIADRLFYYLSRRVDWSAS